MQEEAAAQVIDLQAHRLVIELAAALHAAGAPAHRLEASVAAVCRTLGIDGQVFAQPTSLMLDLDGHTRMLRVEPREVALDELLALHGLVRALLEGQATVAQARVQLAALALAPPPWSLPLQLLAWAGAAGAAAVFFGGGPVELVLASLASAGLGLAAHRAPGRADLGRLLPLAGALLTALLAAGLGQLLPLSADAVVLSALIVLLPGFTLTTGLTELATGHLAAGTARMAAAGTTFLQLGVGVLLGRAVAARLWPPLELLPHGSSAAAPWVAGLSVVLAALSFLVLFRGRGRDLPAIVGVAFVAVYGTRAGGELLGADAAPFLGALAVALLANLYARWRDVPAQVLLVPGIILLVPGSLGFRGIQALVEAGGQAGTAPLLDGARMFLVAASLVTGVLAANALLPPRREL